MEKYKFYRILQKKNKEGKEYFIALIILDNDYDSDFIRVLISKDVANKLLEMSKSPNFDISKYLTVSYNTYSKDYRPVIKL